jgi:hypothetical protein
MKKKCKKKEILQYLFVGRSKIVIEVVNFKFLNFKYFDYCFVYLIILLDHLTETEIIESTISSNDHFSKRPLLQKPFNRFFNTIQLRVLLSIRSNGFR